MGELLGVGKNPPPRNIGIGVKNFTINKGGHLGQFWADLWRVSFGLQFACLTLSSFCNLVLSSLLTLKTCSQVWI